MCRQRRACAPTMFIIPSGLAADVHGTSSDEPNRIERGRWPDLESHSRRIDSCLGILRADVICRMTVAQSGGVDHATVRQAVHIAPRRNGTEVSILVMSSPSVCIGKQDVKISDMSSGG